jgi:hypothetical protein
MKLYYSIELCLQGQFRNQPGALPHRGDRIGPLVRHHCRYPCNRFAIVRAEDRSCCVDFAICHKKIDMIGGHPTPSTGGMQVPLSRRLPNMPTVAILQRARKSIGTPATMNMRSLMP